MYYSIPKTMMRKMNIFELDCLAKVSDALFNGLEEIPEWIGGKGF